MKEAEFIKRVQSLDQERLDKLISKCQRCPLAKSRTKVVMGEGPIYSKLVFIGEAPGRREDLSGKPFVGASGKYFDDLLRLIGLKRNEVYITNMVKCRPPENRDPYKSEIEKCQPYLLAQLKLINPKLIVTLGRLSTDCFIPGKLMAEIHGKAGKYSDLGDWIILPLYHPAAGLYRNSLKETIIRDFKKIVKYL